MRLIIVVLFLMLAGCKTVETMPITFKADAGDVKISAEIADTHEERSVGLMNRGKLGEKKGMIFLFDGPQRVSFYMKNTLIPLDIIYIGEDDKIFQIVKADPCTTENCELFPSAEPISYVVEVNQGFTEQNGIGIGTSVVLRS